MASCCLKLRKYFSFLLLLFLLDSTYSAALRDDIETPVESLEVLSQKQIIEDLKEKGWAETR